jgi:CDP-4-dehydro-6-deoxyglucose reductase, E1
MISNELDTDNLKGVIEQLIKTSSRINESKSRRYWYPLSIASYGIEEILEAIDSMCSFRTTMWEKTIEFESKFTNFQGSKDSVMVNSGSSADLLLCFLLNNPLNTLVESDKEILVPVVTWPTQIWSILMAGYKVRLVDIDPHTLNIDINDLKNKITPNTKAIFVVHVMGNPCDMNQICDIAKTNNLIIIEDCCEALGAKWDGENVGNFGLAASYSFFFSHHITTMEGGMIACSSNEVADQLKILRAHGWTRNIDADKSMIEGFDIDPRYAFVNWGFNLRPTELQAGFGLHQIEKLPKFNENRLRLANLFFNFLDSQPFLSRPTLDKKASPAWFALPIIVSENSPFSRNNIVQYLEEDGVETRPIIAGNIAKHPVSKVFPFLGENIYSGADIIHKQGFYVGLSPFHSEDDICKLIDSIKIFLNRY